VNTKYQVPILSTRSQAIFGHELAFAKGDLMFAPCILMECMNGMKENFPPQLTLLTRTKKGILFLHINMRIIFSTIARFLMMGYVALFVSIGLFVVLYQTHTATVPTFE